MLFGDGSAAAKQAVELAKAAVRSTDNFNWTFITFLAIVVVVYAAEYKKRNYGAIFAALGLYGVHWFYEIMNACICAIFDYPLWTVSAQSTTFILLIGVSWELSMMFAIAGFTINLMPEEKHIQCGKLKVNTRALYVIGNAALFSAVEIFLAGTPAFIWVYKWWGALPVFITTYIPFFLAAALMYDAKPKTRAIFVGSIFALDFLLLAILVPLGVI